MDDERLVRLKELLPETARRIELIDFFSSLSNEAVEQLTSDAFATSERPTEENVPQRVEKYEEILAELLRSLFVGSYYGDMPYHLQIWTKAIARLIDSAGDQPTGEVFSIWESLRRYPGLLGLYAVGTSALAGGRPETLAHVLRDLNLDSEVFRDTRSAIDWAASILSPDKRPTAASSWLEGRLTVLAYNLIRADELLIAFDQFEYCLGLLAVDRSVHSNLEGDVYVRPSRFWFRARVISSWSRPDAWAVGTKSRPLIDAGLFGGSSDRLKAVKARYDEAIERERLNIRLGF
jgi:hypothetical protein